MKTESTIKPDKYKIESEGNNNVAILFFDNVKEVEKDEQKSYVYDMFVLHTKKQDNLEDRLKNNYTLWLEFARQQELNKLSTEIRAKRDDLLSQTDWTQMQDTALSEEKQKEYQVYRQALRDIPEQANFPYDVVFPTLP